MRRGGDIDHAIRLVFNAAVIPMQVKSLYMVRHTKPNIASGICYGSSDIEIDKPVFESESKEIMQLLPAAGLVVSSPLQRCLCLAQRITAKNSHFTLHIENDFAERDFGDWENTLWDDIPRVQINAWRDDFFDYIPPNGESISALQKRVTVAWQRWDTYTEPACLIVIAHAGPLAIIHAHVMDHLISASTMQRSISLGGIVKITLGLTPSETQIRPTEP
jgi:alpha-ribazole phosphatase